MGYLEKREPIAIAASRKFFSDINFKELNQTNFPADDIKAAWLGNIQCGNKVVEIIVSLPQDFPDVLPKIYLSKPDELPLIPHVDEKAFVCTFDREHITFFSENIEGMLSDSIDQARQVLSEGIAGTNANDFTTEMLAYWDIGIKSPPVYSNFAPSNASRHLMMAYVTSSDRKRTYLLSENEDAAKQFATNLKLNINNLKFESVLYLPNIPPFTPPFPKTNSELLVLLDESNSHNSDLLLTYLNIHGYWGYVVFSTVIEGSVALGGWVHQPQSIKAITQGYRRGHVDNRVLRTRIAEGVIDRLKICRLDSKRIHSRVGLDTQELNDKTVCIIGCGSIGSKIAFNVYREGIGRLILIDDEELLSENMGRHLCGISELGNYKVDAVKRKVLDHYPDADVVCISTTFNEAHAKYGEIIDKSDLIVSCTANIALERTLNNIFHTNIEFPSVLYTWTEPFGMASHAVMIGNRAEGCYECCLNPTNLHYYREVVVSDPVTYVRNEAGCQTSFIPYSSLDVEQAATLTTRLSLGWLLCGIDHNIGITYIGDISKAKKMNIKISERYIENQPFSHITFDIEKNRNCKVCSVESSAN